MVLHIANLIEMFTSYVKPFKCTVHTDVNYFSEFYNQLSMTRNDTNKEAEFTDPDNDYVNGNDDGAHGEDKIGESVSGK